MNNILGKCNCGRDGRYWHGEDNIISCNKYVVCPTYAELDKLAQERLKDILELLDAANGLRTFREGTGHYFAAEVEVHRIKNKYNVAGE